MNNPIINVLMKRDNMSKEDAVSKFKEVRSMVREAVNEGSYSEAEDIVANELGLELDYVMYIL